MARPKRPVHLSRDSLGERALAWALIEAALVDYWRFHHEPLRGHIAERVRQKAIRAGCNGPLAEKRVQGAMNRLEYRATSADLWIRGSYARYPFWLAAAWLGWDADSMAFRLLSKDTGWHTIVRLATTEKNKDLPEADRVTEFLNRGANAHDGGSELSAGGVGDMAGDGPDIDGLFADIGLREDDQAGTRTAANANR